MRLLHKIIFMLFDLPGSTLTKILREFGVIGVVTYVGGVILLTRFVFESDFYRQVIFGVVGVILLSLSVFIAFFKLKIQKDREKALINMAESTCNRLAEQLAKSLSEKSIEVITQKIRQTQRDLIVSIVGGMEPDKNT